MDNRILAKITPVTNFGLTILGVGLVVTLLSHPFWALVGGLGLVVSSIAKLSEREHTETRRRKLSRLSRLFGSTAIVMSVLCLIAIVASLFIAKFAVVGPVVFFTLLTCWIPLVVVLARNRR
ncbi:MAG: hypothetical protein JNM34_09600 [Chthonomonadaceae bacterium]|nr:hypothetical protein [Chthonomonadaceae bacterium]